MIKVKEGGCWGSKTTTSKAQASTRKVWGHTPQEFFLLNFFFHFGVRSCNYLEFLKNAHAVISKHIILCVYPFSMDD